MDQMVETPLIEEELPDPAEVTAVARGIATAVAGPDGLTDVQVVLLESITKAVTDTDVDYASLEPLDADALAVVLAPRGPEYRQRIVQHMVLGELVLSPLPPVVAERVTATAVRLGVEDEFVKVARRYAEGTLGLAWVDLRRSGFTDRWTEESSDPLYTKAEYADPFDFGVIDPDLAERWRAFEHLGPGSLGRAVSEMYNARGFPMPGEKGGAAPYLAQHDFVHVLADYGTNIECELETFALIGRADPDPRGFAWLATVIGLFETGHVHQQGFLEMDLSERPLQSEGMTSRLADAIRRGKAVAHAYGTDLLSVDYHEMAEHPVTEIATEMGLPPKAQDAVKFGSAGVFEPAGMSETQRAVSRSRSSRETTAL